MFTGHELDHGTPQRDSTSIETVTIDGVSVRVPRGTSIMRAAVAAGVKIPKLCATDSLEPFGSCRLCLVEIEGRKGTPASCTTPVESGMTVHTQSPRLAALRRNVMELYISDHPARLPYLSRERRLRAPGHGGRGGSAKRPIRVRRRESSARGEGRIESLFQLRFEQVHRLQPLRARL